MHVQSAQSPLPSHAASSAEGAFPNRPIPVRKGRPVIGSTIEFQKDQLGFVQDIHRDYGDVVKTNISLMDWYFVRDPEIIHEINVRQAKTFVKPALAKRIWKLFLGDGILTADGEVWKRQHDLIKPGFHRHRVEAYGPVMVEYAQQMLKGFANGEARDMRHEINGLAIRILGRTLFAADMDSSADTVYNAMHDISEILVEHINLPLPTPRWWPSKSNRRKIDAIEAIEGVLKRLIADRRCEGTDAGDLLSHLIFARDKEGGLSEEQLRDNGMTLIFAGHETTAHAMTWAWYLLAKYPEVAEKLYQEVRSVCGDQPVNVEHLEHMPYVTQVMKESLRFLPSVWAFMRAPTEDITIKGYTFPKGAAIFISPYVLGRDPRNHPDADKYTPERWTREYERNLPKGAYVPFAAGPRVCAGQGFAQMEMKLLLATFVQNLVPTLADGFEPDLVPELSLHPGKRGLQCKVVFREDAPLRAR